MREKMMGVAICIVMFTMSSAAQNKFPATGNVGIGTTVPADALDIANGALHVGGLVKTPTTTQGSYLNWNDATGGLGETDLINNKGQGSGGWYFYNTPSSGVLGLPVLQITGSGGIAMGTTTPVTALDVANGIIHVAGAVSPATPAQGSYFGWNATNGQGETDFITNPGLGIGGWYFISVPKAGSPETTALKISPGGALTFADGTVQATAWNGVLTGGDYAESVSVSGDKSRYEPGDIIVIDATQHGKFVKSNKPYSTLVAGIYSTKPGLLGRRQAGGLKAGTTEIPMAMVGIVPTKVSTENGPIKDGDLLVTSSTAGWAMKGTDPARMMGAVIGKAMDSLDSGDGVIEVLVRLQ